MKLPLNRWQDLPFGRDANCKNGLGVVLRRPACYYPWIEAQVKQDGKGGFHVEGLSFALSDRSAQA